MCIFRNVITPSNTIFFFFLKRQQESARDERQSIKVRAQIRIIRKFGRREGCWGRWRVNIWQLGSLVILCQIFTTWTPQLFPLYAHIASVLSWIPLTLKVLNFWKFTSYCSLKPLWSGMGEVVPARTLPTLHPPSPPTVHQLLRLAL